MVSIIIGNIIALIASILMVYSGMLKQKKKILYFQTVQIGMSVISNIILGGINRNLLIRKIYLTVGNLTDEKELKQENQYEQVNLFTNYGKLAEKEKEEKVKLEKEKKIQNTIIDLKNRFGKNAIIKGMDLEEDATTIQRNGQIGGHQE